MSGAVKAVKSVVKAVGNVISGVVKAVGKVVSAVVNFVASPFMGMFGVPDAPGDQAESARQQGILVQQQGSNVNIPVIYGYRKVAGAVTFAETGSTNNKYLWVAYVFAEGTVEGIRELFIDDNQLPADTAGRLNAGQIVDITDTTSKYVGRVQLQWFPGVYQSNPLNTQVGTLSICKDAPSWRSNMSYNGMAVLFARYEWKQINTQADADNNPFGGGIPQVQLSILGRRVASLADSATQNYSYGGAGYTERFSYNPAEILLDYLRNPRYGKGLTNAEIDWDSFRTAAAKCATQVTYVTGITGPIITCHYVLDTAQSLFNNTKILLSNMRGYLPYVQGKYKLKIEDAGNDTDILSGSASIKATFTNDGRLDYTGNPSRNIMGDITYTGIDRSAKYNQVVVSYVDPDQKWSVQQVVYPESESERQTYITRDGGRENKGEITFPCITNYAIAKDYAKMIFNKSRFQDSCSFKGDSSCFDLEPGDNIYIDSKILKFGTSPTSSDADSIVSGQAALPWRIVSIKLNSDYTFDIACVRNPDTLYPYTRVGEIDQVTPTYVPKGAEIYYPQVTRTPPIGLVPPNTAPIGSGGSSNPITNPNPAIPPGGAVSAVIVGNIAGTTLNVESVTSGVVQAGMYLSATGVAANTQISQFSSGSSGGVGSYLVNKTQTVSSRAMNLSFTASVNVPSDPPPTVTGLENTVDVYSLSYVKDSSGIYAIMKFKQPDHAMYAGAIFYYKRDTEPFYRTLETTDVPGANQDVTVKMGPLAEAYTHNVYTRVRYSTQQFSTKVAKFNFVPRAYDPTSNPSETIEIVGAGWTLPTSAPPNSRDTEMDQIIGATVLNSGVPYSPRRLSFATKQNTANGTKLNYYIKGLNVYYRQSAKTVWKKSFYDFTQGTGEGSQVTFTSEQTTPPMFLGAAVNTTTTPTNPGDVQLYDIIMRYSYTDGTESTRQFRSMGVRTEYGLLAQLSYDPFYGKTNIMRENVSDYPIITEDIAGPGYLDDPLKIAVGINKIYPYRVGTAQYITFYIDPPPVNNRPEWYGIRIISKKVGDTQVSQDFRAVDMYSSASGEWTAKVRIDFNATYEYVIIPLVYTASGGSTPQYADDPTISTTFYSAGYINEQYDGSFLHNWLSDHSPVKDTYDNSIAKLGTASATVIRTAGFSLVNNVPVAGSEDPRDVTFTVTQSTLPADAYSPGTLTGVKLYYKRLGNTYWDYSTYTTTMPAAGTSFTFDASDMTPVANFGSPIIAGDVYDIIMRFVFTDGTESLKEYRSQITPQSATGGTYQKFYQVNSNIVTIDQAPPGSVTDPRDFNFGLNAVFYYSAGLKMQFNSLTNSERDQVSSAVIRYRAITVGQNTPFTELAASIGVDSFGNQFVLIPTPTTRLEYEIVLTPVVRYNGQRTEATNSWYGRGFVDGVTATNLLTGMNFRQMPTDLAINSISQTVTQTPGQETIVVVDNGWQLRNANSSTVDERYLYYTLKFSTGHISNYHGIDIYRRSVNATLQDAVFIGDGTNGYTKYWGAGRWEKCAEVTSSTHAPVNGITTVNLRMPVDWTEFNPYYGVTGGSNPTILINPLATANGLSLVATSYRVEYIAVVRTGATGATISTKCSVLPRIFNINDYGSTPLMNTDTTGRYIKDLSFYNAVDTGYQRRLSDARTGLSNNDIIMRPNTKSKTKDATKPAYVPPPVTPTPI